MLSTVVKVEHKLILTTVSRLVALAAMLGMLISYSLWLPQREFPTLPLLTIHNAFSNIERFLPLLLLLVLVIHASGIFLRGSAISLVMLFLLAMVLDTTRIQPWFYQYVLMFSVFISASKNAEDECLHEQAIFCLQIIIASIYIWSGLHKFNLFFPLQMIPWLFQPFITSQDQLFPLLIISGFFLPAIEVLLGIGLLTRNYHRVAVIGLWLMHSIILFAIGPFGHAWNKVVWPWNLLMMLMTALLFWKAEKKSWPLIKLNGKEFYFLAILFLAAIAPAFNFINLWPSYLSWALYSSDTYQAQIYLPKKQLLKLPEMIQQSAMPSGKEDEFVIDLVTWSEAAIGVPIPPEISNYIAAGKYICKLIPDNSAVSLIIFDRPSRLSIHRDSSTYSCEDLYKSLP